MKTLPKLAAGLVAAVALTAPSGALAHSNPSIGGVRQHIRGADEALATVAARVKDNADAAAAIAMVQNLRQTKAAMREAVRIHGRAKQAKALRLVAAQRNENVDVLSQLVDDVEGDAQLQLATGLTNNLGGRQTAIDKLTALAKTLPAAAQAGIAAAIAAISGHGASDMANISGALGSGLLIPGAQTQMQQALSMAGTAMFNGVSQLQQIVGMLPGPAQGPVNAAIAKVTGILQAIFGNGGPGAGGGPGGHPGPPAGIVGNLPIPTNLPVPCGLPIPSFLPFAKPCHA